MDTQTLYSKLSTTPAPIKTWLGSDAVIAIIDGLEGGFILPSGSASTIAKLIQKIQIKDILPEYFSGELAAELGLDKNKATHITEEVKKNIFSPIKNDCLAYGINVDLLDKFQMPLIKRPEANTTSTPIPTPKPTPLSDVGWSKMPTTTMTTKSVPTSTPTPAPASPPVFEPAPVMLHEDMAFKAAEKNVGFTLAKPQGGAEMKLGNTDSTQAPLRPAVLEFGATNRTNRAAPRPDTPRPPAPVTNFEPRNIKQVTVVPVAPDMPIKPLAPLTPPVPPIPKPPMPSAPSLARSFDTTPHYPPIPQPPKPPSPQPPTSSQTAEKAIEKDFL